jgi:hypothetical protein
MTGRIVGKGAFVDVCPGPVDAAGRKRVLVGIDPDR